MFFLTRGKLNKNRKELSEISTIQLTFCTNQPNMATYPHSEIFFLTKSRQKPIIKYSMKRQRTNQTQTFARLCVHAVTLPFRAAARPGFFYEV